jgi:hypothetical protein
VNYLGIISFLIGVLIGIVMTLCWTDDNNAIIYDRNFERHKRVIEDQPTDEQRSSKIDPIAGVREGKE